MASGPTPSDETLVARMAARDPEALACLYDRYRFVLFSLALRVLRERPEAEEALTDAFLQAWEQASSFDPGRGTVAGWLVMLCRSRAIDRLRARGRRETALDAWTRARAERRTGGESARERPDEAAEIALRRRRIQAALEQLSPQQRDAIELAYYGGLSHSEIAARLGEPLGTVKTRIRQGLMTLRESLGAQFGG